MSLSPTPEFILPHHMKRKPGPKPKAKKHHAIEKTNKEVHPNGVYSLTDFLTAPEQDLRARYGTILNKDEALRELSRLRKICEIAATQINQRLVPDESKCLICKRDLPAGMKVTMMTNVRDEESGTVTTHPICSVECVKKLNKMRMGLEEMIK